MVGKSGDDPLAFFRPAYYAGFFDGEGYIYLRKNGKKPGLYSLVVGLGQTLSASYILDKLQQEYGGSIYKYQGKTGRPFRKWVILGESAAGFLKNIFPFLIVKREQVELALEFQRSLIYNRQPRQGKGGRFIGVEIPSEVIQRRTEIFDKIKALKWA